MFKETRIEVLSVMAHLILTILIISAYVVLRFRGVEDETMKYLAISAAAYFFGTTGTSIIKSAISNRQSDTTPPAPVDTPAQQPITVNQTVHPTQSAPQKFDTPPTPGGTP